MINIISPEQKQEIRAARINAVLIRYSVMVLILTLVTGAVYGLGFWLVSQDEKAIKEVLSSQTTQIQTYAAVEKEAEVFRQNLAIAKTILDKETSYSTFLLTLAKDIPDETILTNLSLGSASAATNPQTGLTLDARASSYAKVLELKTSLEASSLFENVNIVSASRPDNIGELAGLEARYPYEASFNVKLSSKRPGATP